MRLAAPLRTADKAALDLMMEWTRQAALTVTPEFGSEARRESSHSALTVTPEFGGPELGSRVRRPESARVAARDVPALLDQIRELAAAQPDADFEITWQVIDR